MSVKGVDHLAISVSNFEESKKFYSRLLKFLGFKVLARFKESMGWTNGKTRLWISQADGKRQRKGYRFGDVGFHHYAFRLGARREVAELQNFLREIHAKIVDPAGRYYKNYYGVYFEDPDGLELEGMWYGK